jgi:hypothetical protein
MMRRVERKGFFIRKRRGRCLEQEETGKKVPGNE